MDISLEFDDDNFGNLHPADEFVDTSDEVIKKYLRDKIDDVKRLSVISQKNLTAIEKHQNQCLKYLKESEYFNSVCVNVKSTWQRVYNGKWIIGIRVENTAQRSAEKPNIILKCNPKQDLKYSVIFYTKFKEEIPEELTLPQKSNNEDFNELINNIKTSFVNPPKWISTQNLQKDCTIIILVDIPEFIEFRELELQGILSFEMSNKTYQTQLPKISLKVEDILTDDLSPKLTRIISGTEEDILSILSTSEVTPVKVIIPEGLYRTLEGILQLDCSFTKTEAPVGEDTILVFDGKSDSLSFSMLKVSTGKCDVELITKNDDQLYLLYHHLYKNIPDVIILNDNCEQIVNNSVLLTRPTQSFFEPVLQDQTVFKDFFNSFDEQLIFIENKIKKSNSLLLCETKEDYKLFRHKLSDLEKKTDELFFKAFDKKV